MSDIIQGKGQEILKLPIGEQVKAATRAYIKHEITKVTFDYIIKENKRLKAANGQTSFLDK